MMTTCCHGVSALKSTVTSPVPVTALMQIKRASTYLTLNVVLDAESMPAAIIGTSVLIETLTKLDIAGLGSILTREQDEFERN